jgi:hypothetical protein
MEAVPSGFVLFGGMSPDGLSDQLWFFNLVSILYTFFFVAEVPRQ